MSKVFIEESTLTAIGDAIRSKEGSSALIAPLDMADKITNLPSGGGGNLEVEPIVLTGNQIYGCCGPMAGFYIDNFGDTVSTQNLNDISYMFYNNTAAKIPFDLNCVENTLMNSNFLFQNCVNLTEHPNINNLYPSGISNFFRGCKSLREIRDDIDATWNWDRIHTYDYASTSNIFEECYSLRRIPESFIAKLWTPDAAAYSSTYTGIKGCYTLDELRRIPIEPATFKSSAFNNFVYQCYRLKDIIFDMNEDGTPKIVNWKNQSIILSQVGYASYGNQSSITGYNSGITADKEVTDDASYQALKNDPDWFTTNRLYSRYNHDSAVNTINSLPDTSAYLAANGGTNTIHFNAEAGEKTDGGAINTLTEEEIAVAAAKGWTVSFR